MRPERASFLMSSDLGSQSTLQHFGAKRNDLVNVFLGQLHLSTLYVRVFLFSTHVWNVLLCFLRKFALNALLLENQHYIVPLWCWRGLWVCPEILLMLFNSTFLLKLRCKAVGNMILVYTHYSYNEFAFVNWSPFGWPFGKEIAHMSANC